MTDFNGYADTDLHGIADIISQINDAAMTIAKASITFEDGSKIRLRHNKNTDEIELASLTNTLN